MNAHEDHVVAYNLHKEIERNRRCGYPEPVMEAILAYGHPFTPIRRPSGFRLRKPRTCFYSAGAAESAHAKYVEGFAMCGRGFGLIYHAWVATDGNKPNAE